jgi:2-polyprenyl-3-methyl-5-hydroxy-6-metoxy-1,4-benzoquinol methylase
VLPLMSAVDMTAVAADHSAVLIGYVRRKFAGVRRRFTERSYARYFSAEVWQGNWARGYGLNETKEDGRYGTLLRLMDRYAAGGPVLDVGCGDGILEERFCAAVPVDIVGIDYSPAAIARANARNIPNCKFLQADYRDFRSAQRFPLIVLNESLYYVEEFTRVMRDLSGRLAHDGVFIVSMYDTRVTRRIWKALDRTHVKLQGIDIRDEATGERWTIRVLRPAE